MQGGARGSTRGAEGATDPLVPRPMTRPLMVSCCIVSVLLASLGECKKKVTFNEMSHKIWAAIDPLVQQEEGVRDQIHEINEKNNEAEESSLLQLDESLNPRAQRSRQWGKATKGITRDDDDKTENDVECKIRLEKILEKAEENRAAFSSDDIALMKKANKRICEMKKDPRRIRSREVVAREMWYVIRADSLQYKNKLDRALREYMKLYQNSDLNKRITRAS